MKKIFFGAIINGASLFLCMLLLISISRHVPNFSGDSGQWILILIHFIVVIISVIIKEFKMALGAMFGGPIIWYLLCLVFT